MALRIYLKKIVGQNCESIDEGTKILQLISPELLKGFTVELDFTDINSILTPFLNACFGKLLEHFGKEMTMTHVVIRNVSSEALYRINEFIDRKDAEFTKNSDQEILQEMFDEDGLTDSAM